ncbi:hypothetical protein VTI28DRAFT_7604 [Corynascus sepedonium]
MEGDGELMRDAAGTFATVAEATLANVLWLATWGLRGAAKLMWLLFDDLTSTISTSPSSHFLKNHTSSYIRQSHRSGAFDFAPGK